MRMVKRGGGELIRPKKKNMTCTGGGEAIELIEGDVHGDNQDFWGELIQEVASNSSKSVVSVIASDGNSVLFACSGIAIERQGDVTRFLTSANLANALNARKDRGSLKVEVRHEGNIGIGLFGECDLDLGIAVVNVMTFLNVQVVVFNHLVEFLPYSKVVAVGRGMSGELMSTGGMLIPDASGSEDSADLMLSTCEISEAWVGGPLFDMEGNFVGVNLLFAKERTLFLPISIIFERLLHFRMSCRRSKFLVLSENFVEPSVRKVLTKESGADLSRTWKKDKRTDDLTRSKKSNRTDDLVRSSNKNGRNSSKNKLTCNGGRKTTDPLILDACNEGPFWDRDSMGYLKILMDMRRDGEVLVNSFEDTFGDVYGGGVWSELTEIVSSNLSENIVALASFYGEKRIFACTGYFVEWNGCATILTSASLVSAFVADKKIAENLRIEVLLPSKKERRGGTLLHYNLHYNVALVDVKDFCAHHPVNIQHQRHNQSSNVVAAGCCFESGLLMAARGQQTSMSSRLGCKLLRNSTCKITKAGIGGPLVDLDGKFIGMNFYSCGLKRTQTPFLPSDVILDVLTHFKTKRTVAEVGHDGYAPDPGVLDWTTRDDSSVCPNSWHVVEARYRPRVSVDAEDKLHLKRLQHKRPPALRIVDGKKYCFL